jgi:cytochrome c
MLCGLYSHPGWMPNLQHAVETINLLADWHSRLFSIETDMKKLIYCCVVALGFTFTAHAAEDGLALYKGFCSACHVIMPPPTLAPPLFGIKRNLTRSLQTREAFVSFVTGYVHKPDATKSLMPDAVARFKLMPALPYPEDKVRAIAEFIYDTDLSTVQ